MLGKYTVIGRGVFEACACWQSLECLLQKRDHVNLGASWEFLPTTYGSTREGNVFTRVCVCLGVGYILSRSSLGGGDRVNPVWAGPVQEKWKWHLNQVTPSPPARLAR